MQAGLPRIGLRGRLFLVSVLLIAVVGTGSALLLRSSLRDLLEARFSEELYSRAGSARLLIEALDPAAQVLAIDTIVDDFSSEPHSPRITVIDASGRVLGDSTLGEDEIARLANQAAQQEVRAVLSGHSTATLTRRAEADGTEMLLAAIPYRATGHHGVIRAGIEVEVFEQAMAPFNLAVGAVGIAGLGVAVFMSGLASHLASRDLRNMLERVQGALARSREGTMQAQDEQDLSVLAGGVQDLAQRWRRASDEANAERSRLSAVLDSLNEGVLAIDAHGRVTGANPAAVRLLQVQGSPLGRSLVDIVRAAAIVSIVRGALSGETDESAEVELHDGQFLMATARPLHGQAGCVLVLHDLSAMRKLERVRRDFVANVSHELRTPVTIIRTNAESLADGALDDPNVAPVFLQAILRNTVRLGQLINDLLDLSRIESGRQVLRVQACDLRAATERTIEGLKDRAQETGCTLCNDLLPGTMVLADSNALEQILTNLLENAVKYAGTGSTVRVFATPAGARLKVAVEDDGPGIAERHRERVFERFYRVDSGRARLHGGTGLGLAIVKNLVDAMQGSAGLESVRPRGCRFWFELPAAGSPPQDEQPGEKPGEKAHPA